MAIVAGAYAFVLGDAPGRRVSSWQAFAALSAAAALATLAGAASATKRPANPRGGHEVTATPRPAGERHATTPTHASARRDGDGATTPRHARGASAAGKPHGSTNAGGATESGGAKKPGGVTNPGGAAGGGGAVGFVRDYYRALDARRFREAWVWLAPSVRANFGGFARWEAGYARTISSAPSAFVVGRDGEVTTVTHLLTARDRGCAGVQSYRVTWRLERAATRFRVVGLSAVALGARRCG
jgi:hypothetical protein